MPLKIEDERLKIPLQSQIHDRRLRIALLGPLPDGGLGTDLGGGVEAVVQSLTAGLAARAELEVHALTSVPGIGTAETLPRAGFTLHRVPHPRGDRLLWHQPAVWPVRRELDHIRPDVIHAHMAGHYADAALSSGRPNVITLHGVVFREAALALAGSPPAARVRWLIDAWYERWLVRRAKDIIAISPYVAQEYRSLTRAAFHEIENPVDERFFAVPEATAPPDAAPVLLCVARVIPRKDIVTLLEAFARVRGVIPAARLEIAGGTDTDPEYTEACREAAARLDLDASVLFLGSLQGQALAEAYARADVVLLTSRQETAPVVIAEAMASARPVVATRVGGVPTMVTESVTGLLADAGDVVGLADAALSLLLDSGCRLAYGQAARRTAERRFRLAAIVDRTVELYARLVAGRRGAA